MSRKRKRSSYSLKDKLEVLQRLDSGESATKLALEFNVGKTTISDWKKNRTKIEQFCATASADLLDKRKTSKVSSFDKVDEALFLWFVQERDKGVNLNGPLIQMKALELNALLNGESSFTASNGWMHRWKKRHGIHQTAMCGGKLQLHEASVDEYKVQLQNVFSSDDSDDCNLQNDIDSDTVPILEINEADSEESKNGDTISIIKSDPVSHIEGAAALEVALRYVKQHSMSTATDVMFIQRWRDIAASTLFSSLHQTKLTEFILKKDL